MLTPQKKVWSGWSLSPRTRQPGQKNGSGPESGWNLNGAEKGKEITTVLEATPQNGETMDLVERLSKLGNELFKYQYNMGLLLIEKKEWGSKYDEMQLVFTETEDSLKRERASHLIAMSEVEKREENLRKALVVEKQCVLDLEKALSEMRSEYAEIKFTSDSKLAEANALITSIEEKSLEIESRMHAVDAKNAEVSRKSSEIGRKAEDVEVRENALHRERLSFNAEQEAHMGNISKQREDLREWERKLQEDEERLDEVRRLLNQREERANENDNTYQQKQIDLEDLQKKIESANFTLKKKQDNMSSRIEKLTIKEKEADSIRKSLEMKEKELLELEEKLKAREQRELLLKEGEDLKQEKERFEKEWEDLDEKRDEIKKELEFVTLRMENLEKLKRTEEERLHNEKLETQSYVERELEALKLAKDSFAANMEHEKSMMAERTQIEKNQLVNDFELWKREVETKLLNEKEAMETGLRERGKLFDEEKEKEMNNINYLREVVGRETEEMELERSRIEKEKQEISMNQKHLDGQHLEMRKDIDELIGLSRKLKEQREQFLEERERFIMFVENHKSCKSCGELTSEFVLSGLKSLSELNGVDAPPLPKLAKDYLRETVGTPDRAIREASPGAPNLGSLASGRTMSWLRKCTSKIFVFSASKKNESAGTGQDFPRKNLRLESSSNQLLNTEEESKVHFDVAGVALNVQNIQSKNGIGEFGSGLDQSVDEHSNINSKEGDVVEDSQQSGLRGRSRKPGKRGRGKVSRKRSVKAVVEDVKAILGDAIELNDAEHSNGVPSVYTNEGRGDSSLVGKGVTRNGRKQSAASEIDPDYSEAHSDSVTAGGCRKRRQQIVPSVQTPVGKRYNLRRPKTAAPIAGNGDLPAPDKDKDGYIDGGGGSRGEIAGEDHGSTQLMQVKTLKSIEDVNEFSSARDHGTKLAAVSQDGDGDTANQFVDDMVLSDKVDGTPVVTKEYEKQQDGDGDAANQLVDYMVLSEEVSGTPVGIREYEKQQHRSGSHRKDDDDGEDDDEVEHPGEVSISKKFWTFLTT